MTNSTRSNENASELPASRHRVTAYDVARLAGVSQSAVSRAFTPGTSISARTRLNVTEAARKLKYRPNLIARSLSTRRSNIVGVTVPPLGNQFYPAMLEALSESLGPLGYRVLLFTAKAGTSSDPVLEDVLNSRVDALVMVSAAVSSKFADECRQVGLPVVLLNRKTDSKLVSSVTGANRHGAEEIASFLLAGRHKRFAFVAGEQTSSTSRDRENAFTRRLAKSGKHLSARVVGNYSFQGAMAAAREMFSSKSRPDAVFCANDHMALAVINIARAEFGLDVGREVSIVGFDDAELSDWPLFSLTTFSQPIQQMANHVTEIIHRQLDGVGGPATEVIVPGELVVRGSARIPRNGLSGPAERRVWTSNKNF